MNLNLKRKEKPKKRKLNRYEEEQNFALFLMKLGCFIVILINLLVGTTKPFHLGYKNPLVWINCIIIIYMCLKGLGIFSTDNSTNFIPWTLLRIAELFIVVACGFGEFNWVLYLVVRSIEILYIAFLVIDQLNYEFVEEDAETDKYSDFYK
ncbi:hypothetical protein [uncultured Clostridium sp.]|uniref:hypothetical protein n=1 Tax=uncultured Clostridium sp. TaxID=59620 RepID=UPI0026F3A805|nr:hypothetical protein [uncultured Clostridium sp.]